MANVSIVFRNTLKIKPIIYTQIALLMPAVIRDAFSRSLASASIFSYNPSLAL
jgi:hypothetical protein